MLALPAGLTRAASPLTDQCLRKPQGQTLLANALRALKQERLWQPAGGDGAYQPVSGSLMAIQGGYGHGGNLA